MKSPSARLAGTLSEMVASVKLEVANPELPDDLEIVEFKGQYALPSPGGPYITIRKRGEERKVVVKFSAREMALCRDIMKYVEDQVLAGIERYKAGESD